MQIIILFSSGRFERGTQWGGTRGRYRPSPPPLPQYDNSFVQVVRALIGFAYPSYQSLQVAMVAFFIINILKRQAAMTDDPEDDLQWLRYWVVLATVHMIELVFVILITNMFLLECSSIKRPGRECFFLIVQFLQTSFFFICLTPHAFPWLFDISGL